MVGELHLRAEEEGSKYTLHCFLFLQLMIHVNCSLGLPKFKSDVQVKCFLPAYRLHASLTVMNT